jgi:hypothetical protein
VKDSSRAIVNGARDSFTESLEDVLPVIKPKPKGALHGEESEEGQEGQEEKEVGLTSFYRPG